MNNLTKLLVITFISVFLASCGEDPIPQPDKNEEYTRAFIKEFGTPVGNHSYSMATTAGLQVKTSRNENITITGVYEGEEYLFADLTVRPGVNPIPVTIPSAVTELRVNVGGRIYVVPSDGVFDLDNPTATSRAVIETEWYDDGSSITVNEVGDNPIIAFKYSDFLKKFFEGKQYEFSGSTTEYGTSTKILLLNCETGFGTNNNVGEITYDIFPIYWESIDDKKDFEMLMHHSLHTYLEPKPLDFSVNPNKDIPFPGLGYSTEVDNVNSINFSTFAGFKFDDGDLTQAFPTDAEDDIMIVSKGHKITFKTSGGSPSINLDLRYNHQVDGSYSLSSSGTNVNYSEWGDNYFRTTLSQLGAAFGSTRRIWLDTQDFSIYDPSEDGFVECPGCTQAFLIGFCPAASCPDDSETSRDCRKLVYLVVPQYVNKTETVGEDGVKTSTYKYKSELAELYKSKPTPFKWTIAAEDLGGTYDWDFNDAVFFFTDVVENLPTVNYYYNKKTKDGKYEVMPCYPRDARSIRAISVTALAAGGTLPIYMTYTGKIAPALVDDGNNPFKQLPEEKKPDMTTSSNNVLSGMYLPYMGSFVSYSECNKILGDYIDNEKFVEGTYIIGTELHKMASKKDATPYNQPYNVDAKRTSNNGTKITFCMPVDCDPYAYKFTFLNDKSKDNENMIGFAILVDRNDEIAKKYELTQTTFTKIDGYELGNGSYLVGKLAEGNGKLAPQMLLMATQKMNEWRWPREEVNIQAAYPKFKTWLTNPSVSWHTDTPNMDVVTWVSGDK